MTIEEIDNEYYSSDITNFTNSYYKSPNVYKDSILFLNGYNAKPLTQEIVSILNYPLGRISCERKAYGESDIKVLENVSNRNVIYIHSLAPPLNDNLLEMLMTISTLKRSSASKIIVVIPYFGYGRKLDKDTKSNMPLHASFITKLIEQLGASQILTINLSSKHVTGYSYSIPIIDLDMTCLGVSYFLEKLSNNQINKEIIVIAPHVRSAPRAKYLQELLNKNGFEAGLGFIAKESTSQDNYIDFHVNNLDQYVGDDFTNKDVIIMDDEICTGNTIINLSKYLKSNGSNKIFGFVYHDLMQEEDALLKIEDSEISELVILNTLNTEKNHSDRIIRLSISKVLSKYLDELVKKDIELNKKH